MFSYSKYKNAVIILVAAFALDFFIRAYFYNRIKIVVASESLLFFFISLILLLVAKRDKTHSRKTQRFDLWLTLFFFLGGTRSALWAIDFNIYIANSIILLLGVVAGAYLIRWWNRSEKTN